jgi:uncharacterized protein YdeI (BOF family)
MSHVTPITRRLLAILLVIAGFAAVPAAPAPVRGAADHLVISEVVTGGASASDELIELHNPTAAPLPLEGLELVYASATGATVSRRATWALGAPQVPPGGHVLVANEAGIYAPIADATYASGMAASGGSVALRILGASSAIDAVGWGTATSTWREGATAGAPATGASIERLPGGAQGSGQDTDDNAADFTERPVPDPQNIGSPPTPLPGDPPDPDPTITPLPEPTPIPEPTPLPTGQPPDAALTIAAARALPDGTRVTIEGVALTGSSFHDGGGFVADATGGIAVIADGATFDRGAALRLSGTVEDRFAQRTLRVEAADLVALGSGTEPGPQDGTTLGVAEAAEGALVRVTATIVGGRSELASGVAFDIDDGSGPTRLLVQAVTGIDLGAWATGTSLTVVGVVGQRDSSGTGAAGYRLMPRDAADVAVAASPPSQAPSASPSASAAPSGSPAAEGTMTVAAARAAERNATVTVRAVVTLPSGVVDDETAVVQDATGAIVIRLGSEVGTLRLGEMVELSGARSTKSGMETIRVSEAPVRLGTAELPEAALIRTGEAAEAIEARRVVVRGALLGSARRSSSGSVTFDIDDGSGTLKVAAGAGIGLDTAGLEEGTWVEVSGILGQQTTGSAPTSGYRVWPAAAAAIRVTAAPGQGGDGGVGGSGSGSAGPGGSLGDLGGDHDGLRIGATLVAGPWPEISIGGLLWDGTRLVAIDVASASLVEALLTGRRPPLALDLGGLEAVGIEPVTRVASVRLGSEPGDVLEGGQAAPPTARPGSTPAWASMIGLVLGPRDHPVLLVPHGIFRVEHRCGTEEPRRGLLSVTGVALDRPDRMIVGCGGMRRVPLLGRAGALPVLGARAADERTPPPNTTAPELPIRRTLAAGMLGVGAFGAACVAAVNRRRRHEDPDDGRSAAPSGSSGADTPEEPPRLTLVPLHQERSP